MLSTKEKKQRKADGQRRRTRTKKGLIKRMYARQRDASKTRGHPPPDYSYEQLLDWLMAQTAFHVLFEQWTLAGHPKALVPSCDRLDDYAHYTLSNLRIVTWQENNDSYSRDAMRGKNLKMAKRIAQYDLNHQHIETFYSLRQAARDTGIHPSMISAAATGRYKTSGGFIWHYI